MNTILNVDNFNLSKREYSFFHENSFLVIESLFSEEECDRIYELFCEHADKDFSAIINLDREVPELHNVMKMPKVVSIMENLIDSEAYGLMTQMLFKEAGTVYANQAWTVHQDNAYHQNKNGATVTINIACKDAFVDNGTLYVYPGTHKEGILPFEIGQRYLNAWHYYPNYYVDKPEHLEIDRIASQGIFNLNRKG